MPRRRVAPARFSIGRCTKGIARFLAVWSLSLPVVIVRAGEAPPPQLTRLSLKELADLKVVTVNRREEKTLEAPGSVHVVTEEDIRRTGSVSIPDALRTAPGLQASRIDGDEWALAVRGFASRLSRSVLATIDGRSVWTPLFAGIFWDAHDTVLEDIEQIEVSRGPGGAAYGANALNGVISVTTKSARDTVGGLASATFGTDVQQGAARYGGRLGDRAHYRVFGKYSVRDGTTPIAANGYEDAWKLGLGGFRIDTDPNAPNAFTLLGNLYDGRSFQPGAIATFTAPFSTVRSGDARFKGQNSVGRWKRSLEGGGVRAQVFFDRTTRDEPTFREERRTFDVDLQHQFEPGPHSLIWGVGYRRSSGMFEGPTTLLLIPGDRVDDVFGLFVNDEVRLFSDHLRVVAGTKLEWNDYSGWNLQPSGRLAWSQGRQLFWGSVTRALRTSSRLERDVRVYTSLSPTQPLFARTAGSPDFKPESVVALEAGYKVRADRVLLTAAAFRNIYYDLASNQVGTATLEPGGPGEPTRTLIPVQITNGPKGRASGVEVKIVHSTAKHWRVQGAYSLLRLGIDGEAGKTFKSNSPRHQIWLTSYYSPIEKLDMDLLFRAVSEVAGHRVPSFVDLDARLAYRPTARVELSITGVNLFRDSRVEFGGGFAVERGVRFQATTRF